MYSEQDLLMMKILAAIVFIEHWMFVCMDELRIKLEVMVDVFLDHLAHDGVHQAS